MARSKAASGSRRDKADKKRDRESSQDRREKAAKAKARRKAESAAKAKRAKDAKASKDRTPNGPPKKVPKPTQKKIGRAAAAAGTQRAGRKLRQEQNQRFLDAADKGMDEMSAADTTKFFANMVSPKKALAQFGSSIKQNMAQQERLLDAIQAEMGVDRATAGRIADERGLTSTKRFDVAGSARDRQEARRLEHREGQTSGGSGTSFSDYVAARDAGVPPAQAIVPAVTPAPVAGDPNTMSFTFGGKETTFTPRAILGPQLAREEIASRENIARRGIEANEPGFLDQAAGIGSLISSIWG